MRTTALAVAVALASALALSACAVSVVGRGPRGAQGTGTNDRSASSDGSPSADDRSGGPRDGNSDGRQGGVLADRPVQQPGESSSSFAERRAQYGYIDDDSDFSYDCDDGPWSSTLDSQVVILRGHCTDVSITHEWVEVWVAQADRIDVGAGGYEATLVANQVGDLTIADSWVTVYTGSVGDVTVAPKDAADQAEIHTGTIGPRVTIQADWVDITYDRGSPSVTSTGEQSEVHQR